jgi:hypothetical protein
MTDNDGDDGDDDVLNLTLTFFSILCIECIVVIARNCISCPVEQYLTGLYNGDGILFSE